MSDAFTVNHLNTLVVAQLREICIRFRLKRSAKRKADFITRVQDWLLGLTPHEREQSLQQIDHYVRWASWPAIPGSSAGRGTPSGFSGYSGAIDGDFYIDSLSLLADLQPTLVSAPAPAPAPPNIPPGAVLRCPCGVTTARGPHTMKCDRCGVYQHQSCMVGQFGRAPSSWVCPECRLRSFVSYGQVVRALIPCTFLRGVSRTLFELPHSTYSQVVRDESTNVMLVSTKCSDVVVRPLFPEQVMVHLNHYALDIPRVDPKIRKRTTAQQGPVDVSSSVVPGTNEFNYSERTDGYAFAVFVVRTYRAGEAESIVKAHRTLSMDLALACVRPSVANPTKCSIRARQQATSAAKAAAASAAGAGAGLSFNGSAGAGAAGVPADDDDDDDIVVATGVQLKVKDPVALIPIATPARGIDCNHIQCFDLSVYTGFNSKPSSKFRCPFCQLYLPLSDLWVDPVVKRVLVQVREQDGKSGSTDGTFVPGRGAAFEDVAHVELQADGNWRAVVPGTDAATGAGRGAGAGSSSGRGAGIGAPSSPSRDLSQSRKRKRAAAPAPEIVSLLSDSDDEPPPAAPSAPQRPRTSLASHQPRQATAAHTASAAPTSMQPPSSTGVAQARQPNAARAYAGGTGPPAVASYGGASAAPAAPAPVPATAPAQPPELAGGHVFNNHEDNPDWAAVFRTLATDDEDDWMNL